MSTLSELIHYCNEDDPVGAMLLLGEVPSVREVAGGAIILITVIYAQLKE